MKNPYTTAAVVVIALAIGAIVVGGWLAATSRTKFIDNPIPAIPTDVVKDETIGEMRLGSVIRSWVKILPTGERILVIVDDNSRQSHFILLPPLPRTQVEKVL